MGDDPTPPPPPSLLFLSLAFRIYPHVSHAVAGPDHGGCAAHAIQRGGPWLQATEESSQRG